MYDSQDDDDEEDGCLNSSQYLAVAMALVVHKQQGTGVIAGRPCHYDVLELASFNIRCMILWVFMGRYIQYFLCIYKKWIGCMH